VLLVPRERVSGRVPVRRYEARLPRGVRELTLRYSGRLPGDSGAPDEPRRFDAGHVGPQGVFLGGASHWYPRVGDEPFGFDLEVDLPAGWTAIAAGERSLGPTREGRSIVRWTESHPQDDIVLAANRFEVYARERSGPDAYVYLRRADDALAERYLEATDGYLTLYSRLLGAYPYAKFALVENFWETGYGMPSFTLLGPTVLRLPFIIHSSYPHEILHSWWGNGVYVDYASGNWAEGLTAYLSDHLMQERRGHGADYRHAALQKYRNYVRHEEEFPLEAFRAKHGQASEAIGYNKSLMFFHMLRRRLGDEGFLAGLRRFYAEQRFQVAGYADLRASLEAGTESDLGAVFDQWLTRIGAPSLRLREPTVTKTGSRYRLEARVEQVQEGPAYRLLVPVAVQQEGSREALRATLPMDDKVLRIMLELTSMPLRLAVDPEFDLFRELHLSESPPALGELLGAANVRAVLPADAPDVLRTAYDRLARSLGATRIVSDARAGAISGDGPAWLLGWENRHRAALIESLAERAVSFRPGGVSVHDRVHHRAGECVVLVGRRREEGTALGWIGCDNPRAFTGLSRKLPHYGKYGALSFEGNEPRNVLKQKWPVTSSALNVALEPSAEENALRLSERPTLLDAAE